MPNEHNLEKIASHSLQHKEKETAKYFHERIIEAQKHYKEQKRQQANISDSSTIIDNTQQKIQEQKQIETDSLLAQQLAAEDVVRQWVDQKAARPERLRRPINLSWEEEPRQFLESPQHFISGSTEVYMMRRSTNPHPTKQTEELAKRFIAATADGTNIQEITLTHTQYEEIEGYLNVLKQNGLIDEDIHKTATKYAYDRSGTDPQTIQDLAGKFIDNAINGAKNKGITITDTQSQEIRDTLNILKDEGIITEDIHKKATAAAWNTSKKSKKARDTWNKSDEGKELKAIWDSGEKGIKTRKTYSTSEQGRKTKDVWNKSDEGRTAKDTYYERQNLLETPEGRAKIINDYNNWHDGQGDLPNYVTSLKTFEKFIEDNKYLLEKEDISKE